MIAYLPAVYKARQKNRRGNGVGLQYHVLNALEKWKRCKDIQFENVDFDIPLDQRNCPNCGTQMKLLGKNMVREAPESIPAKLKLKRYWQYTEILYVAVLHRQ